MTKAIRRSFDEAVLRELEADEGNTTDSTRFEKIADLLRGDTRIIVGIHEMFETEPFSFTYPKTAGFHEFVTFIAGRGTLVEHDGTRLPFAPGTIFEFGPGSGGTYEFDESIRVFWVIEVPADYDLAPFGLPSPHRP